MSYAYAQGNSGGSSVQTCLALTAAASAPRRAKILDFLYGNATAPADNAFLLIIQRCTTAGTGTTITPTMADSLGDTLASTIVGKSAVTADPTLTANLFLSNWPVNQRGSVRWIPNPTDEIYIPSTASNGFAFGVSAASTTTQGCLVSFLEL
jgi:hypothetical protein